MSKSNKYLDVLKVLEFGAEGGSEALYRLLPYGESRFVWRTFGNSIGEDDAGEEAWQDYSDEYEDIVEYLNLRAETLAALQPLHIDAEFRDQIFTAFMQSIRQPSSLDTQARLFQTARRWGLAGSWPDWQKHLQLRADSDTLVIHSAFGANAITQIIIDYERLRNVQELLDLVYNALLVGSKPPGTYGKQWLLYDLISFDELVLPRDDRGDRLFDAGIRQGGRWVAHAIQ